MEPSLSREPGLLNASGLVISCAGADHQPLSILASDAPAPCEDPILDRWTLIAVLAGSLASLGRTQASQEREQLWPHGAARG